MVNRLWGRRVRGYMRDCVCYVGIAALEVPVGLALTGTALASNPVFLAVASSVPPLAATLVAARAESGASGATWGKRREALRVATTRGSTPTFGQALGRNAAKIFVPWTLGHVVAFGAVSGGFERADVLTLGATGLLYGWLGLTLVLLVVGEGRTPHDRVSGTRVVSDALGG